MEEADDDEWEIVDVEDAIRVDPERKLLRYVWIGGFPYCPRRPRVAYSVEVWVKKLVSRSSPLQSSLQSSFDVQSAASLMLI